MQRIEMRALRTFIAGVGLAMLLPLGVASATPTLKYKLKAVPIAGFARTGNLLGAGASATLDVTIGGDEYFNSPPPVIGFRFYAPSGSVQKHAQRARRQALSARCSAWSALAANA